jgi:hypothetical protein
MIFRRMLIVAAALLCLTRSAQAGDAAAFENSVASLLKSSLASPPRPNELSFLIGIGEAYCQMKQARGGGPLDVTEALGALHQAHPDLRAVSTDDASFQAAAASEAGKLLCP